MLKTAKQLEEQAKKLGLTFIPLRNCSICNYPYGYHIYKDTVEFDSSCGCCSSYPRTITWGDIAESYNFNQPEKNPLISQEYLEEQDKIWEFSNQDKVN